MFALSFHGIFRMWEKNAKRFTTSFPLFFPLHCYHQVNLHVYFKLIWQTTIIEMPSLIRKEKVTCENCGTQTTNLNLALSKKRCSAGTLYCNQCPNFATKSQNDLNNHFAKKHNAPKPDVTFNCTLCYRGLLGFYASRQHGTTQHRMQIGSRTRKMDVEYIVGDVENPSSREELHSFYYLLVDSELETAVHKVFN